MKVKPHVLFELEENVSLSKYSTYNIGGPARKFVQVSKIEDLQALIHTLKKTKQRYMILGKGSNLLFDDRGFNGVVILNKISFIEWEETKVKVGAGYSFALLGVQTARKGLSGLEFASGIPGSVGGAIFMNAGANKMEVADVIQSVDYITEEGALIQLSKDELEFKYRFSNFQSMKGAIVSATFNLQKAPDAKEKQKKILDYRMSTQPYKAKTCGCVFRNPEGDSAGRLIESCGLKEFSLGGAAVSPMHANFLINKSEAKAEDIKALVKYIKSEVERKTGIVLQEEVRFIPYQEDDHE